MLNACEDLLCWHNNAQFFTYYTFKQMLLMTTLAYSYAAACYAFLSTSYTMLQCCNLQPTYPIMVNIVLIRNLYIPHFVQVAMITVSQKFY